MAIWAENPLIVDLPRAARTAGPAALPGAGQGPAQAGGILPPAGRVGSGGQPAGRARAGGAAARLLATSRAIDAGPGGLQHPSRHGGSPGGVP